jgi:hypothetical protein
MHADKLILRGVSCWWKSDLPVAAARHGPKDDFRQHLRPALLWPLPSLRTRHPIRSGLKALRGDGIHEFSLAPSVMATDASAFSFELVAKRLPARSGSLGNSGFGQQFGR